MFTEVALELFVIKAYNSPNRQIVTKAVCLSKQLCSVFQEVCGPHSQILTISCPLPGEAMVLCNPSMFLRDVKGMHYVKNRRLTPKTDILIITSVQPEQNYLPGKPLLYRSWYTQLMDKHEQRL